MKIEIWPEEGSVLLARNGGESMKISLSEFWEIVRAGVRLDVKEELENYLADGGTFEGVDADTIRENETFLDEVVERVIEARVGNENGNQVYDALCHCVKYGKHKDELYKEKSLADMDVADFKDPARKKEFNGLMHAYRDLKRRMDEQNGMPFGGDRYMQDFLKMRLGDVTTKMDLLRVKEWLSKQPYDLDTENPQYREAMEMLEEICGWAFPELAGMVFDGDDNDLIFREPGDVAAYSWHYYNPDAVAGGQLVWMPFTEEEGRRMLGHPDPISIVGDTSIMEDVNQKGFFITMFDLLQMKEKGWFVGTDIQEVCREIVGPKAGVSQDDVKQRIFESFQKGRSTYELSGWDRGSVVVYCDCDLFTDKKVHFTTEESKFFYDMEQEGQAPAHEHIAEMLAGYVMSGELQWREGDARSVPQECVWHGEVDVPYTFPGCDSTESNVPEIISFALRAAGFNNVSVELMGYYKGGIGLTFSFSTSRTADEARSWLQKALGGLRFEACCEEQKGSLGVRLENARERAGDAKVADGFVHDNEIGI